jgi:inhibitor of cysteine peptidase
MQLFNLVFLITALGLTGCKNPEDAMVLDQKNNGERITVALTQEIYVSLNANPGSGYTWETAELDTAIIRRLPKKSIQPDNPLPGSQGKQTFCFKAASEGKTGLKLIYHRPWEKNIAPIDTFYVQVRVKKQSSKESDHP